MNKYRFHGLRLTQHKRLPRLVGVTQIPTSSDSFRRGQVRHKVFATYRLIPPPEADTCGGMSLLPQTLYDMPSNFSLGINKRKEYSYEST
jgi:hypothetical protein